MKFLRTIDRQVRKGLQIHMILDNYGTHTHDNVVAWLDKHPRFHLHFIPTSSSWLNMGFSLASPGRDPAQRRARKIEPR